MKALMILALVVSSSAAFANGNCNKAQLTNETHRFSKTTLPTKTKDSKKEERKTDKKSNVEKST